MSNFKIIKPFAATNYIPNPSQEGSSNLWTTTGSNSISVDSDNQMFGRKSAECGYQDSTSLCLSALVTVPAAGTYTISAYVYAPSTWDAVLSMELSGFTSATVDSRLRTYTVADVGNWIRITSIVTIDSGDLVGNVFVKSTGDTDFIFVDAMQMEAGSEATTFIDGDQDGCKWVDATYGYAERFATTRMGGKIQDLDDYGLYLDKSAGAGVPPIVNLSTEKVLADGQEHQRFRFKASLLKLIPKVIATSQSDLRSKRRSLVEDLGPIFPSGSEIKIIYDDGLQRPREFIARYDRGLELKQQTVGGFTEVLGFQFIADDPYWYDVGNSAVDLATLNTTDDTSRLIAVRKQGGWDTMGPPANATATYSAVRAIEEGDDHIFIGGDFLNFDDDVTQDYITKWNKYTEVFEDFDATILNAQVRTMKVAADKNTLYIGGDFTAVGGDGTRDYVVSYDLSGGSYGSLGDPGNGGSFTYVAAIEIDFNGNIWICGSFTTINGVANATNIAYFDGTNWNAAGTGANGAVNDIKIDPTTGDIYAVGLFSSMGGVSNTDSIAKWTGSAWEEVGGGVTTGTSMDSLVFLEDGTFYVGGNATEIGGTTISDIAYWNGSQYIVVGDYDPALGIRRLALWKGFLLASENTVSTDDPSIRLWNGSVWTSMDLFATTPVNVMFPASNDDLYLGHATIIATRFKRSGNTTVTNLGTAKSYPIVHIDWTAGVYTTVELVWLSNENEGLNSINWFNYFMEAQENLTIDFRVNSRSMTSSMRGKRWAVLPNSKFSKFVLWPGDNDILCLVRINIGTPTINGWIEWRNAYMGID